MSVYRHGKSIIIIMQTYVRLTAHKTFATFGAPYARIKRRGGGEPRDEIATSVDSCSYVKRIYTHCTEQKYSVRPL